MKKLLRHILILLICAALMLGAAPVSVLAQTGREDRVLVNYSGNMSWPEGPELTAEGAYLIELNSGAVLYSKNSNQQFYPASITKILTALVVIENASLDEMVTFSHNAVYDIEDGGFSYIADVGDQLSVKDLLYALMLYSSNEAAYALAEHVGGSLEGFAVLMNEKAKELGATNSNFVVPHGLTNSEHVTTPHDMACIMWGAIKNETFLEIDSTITYTTAPTSTNPDGYYCQMRHQMMRNTDYYDQRVVAGKTGYISAAGNTLVTYAVSGDKEYICVIMKEQGSGLACQETKKLLDYGDNKFEFLAVDTGLKFSDIEDFVEQKTGRVVANVNFSQTVDVLVPKGTENIELDWSLEVDESVSDEVNSMAGVIRYYYGDKELNNENIVISLVGIPKTTEATTESILPTEAADINEIIDQAKSFNWRFTLLIVSCCVIGAGFLVFVILAVRASRKKKKRRNERRSLEDGEYMSRKRLK